MKKYLALCAVLFLSTSFFSFTTKWGGDIFEIYLNGKRMHQQFVHIDKSVKTLSFTPQSENDKIEVFYSHCGQAGKNRVLTIRNEKNDVIKRMEFGDGTGNHSAMAFFRKDLAKAKAARLNLYYSSSELPEGRLLATIVWNENKVLAKL